MPNCGLTSSVLSYTFNGAKSKVTISKTTHSVIPNSFYNFSFLDLTNQPVHNFSAQLKDIEQVIYDYLKALNETRRDNSEEDPDMGSHNKRRW